MKIVAGVKPEINWDCLKDKNQATKKAKKLSQEKEKGEKKVLIHYILQKGSSNINCKCRNLYVKVNWEGYWRLK